MCTTQFRIKIQFAKQVECFPFTRFKSIQNPVPRIIVTASNSSLVRGLFELPTPLQIELLLLFISMATTIPV